MVTSTAHYYTGVMNDTSLYTHLNVHTKLDLCKQPGASNIKSLYLIMEVGKHMYYVYEYASLGISGSGMFSLIYVVF